MTYPNTNKTFGRNIWIHTGITGTTHTFNSAGSPLTRNTSITFNSKITTTPKNIVSPNNSQTLSDTQHTRQTDPFIEQHIQYKDISLHSPQLRSKRQ